MRHSKKVLTAFAAVAMLAVPVRPAAAGCGCEKPAPAVTSVRPNATYAGTDVGLFHPGLEPGRSYAVTFTSTVSGAQAAVQGVAVLRRDLADGQPKPQVVVALPGLPLGPARIDVGIPGQSNILLAVDDSQFTVIPQPIPVPGWTGRFDVKDFHGAVGRDGTLYLSLDMTGVTQPLVLEMRAKGYPLRFTEDAVLFYNVQGFLMQRLDGGIPGLSGHLVSDEKKDSDILRYARHEFATFYLQHEERQQHAVDSGDPNWHLDGTRHIDHNHLVVAIAGYVQGSASTGIKDDPAKDSVPAPGATRKFKLEVRTSPLIPHAVAARRSITMSGGVRVKGDVLSNGTITLTGKASIDDATAFTFVIRDKAKMGHELLAVAPTEILPVYMPSAADALGSVRVRAGERRTLVGPASFLVSDLVVEDGGELYVDNAAGPVMLYVTGTVQMGAAARITPFWQAAEDFTIYVVGGGEVRLPAQGRFYALVYAPDSPVTMAGTATLVGAIVAADVVLADDARVDYDKDLGSGKSKKRFDG
jgi:hypothetical protein